MLEPTGNLQNAVVNTGDPVYWDENSGPSLASESSVGTIPSESFTILSESTTITGDSPEKSEVPPGTNVVTTPPSPSQTFKVIITLPEDRRSAPQMA